MRIAVLGTGLMGAPMAVRLAEHGHQVTAYNRSRAKVEPLVSHAIGVAATPAEALAGADCALTMLADGPATRDVILGSAARHALEGTTVIQMGTISPLESMELASEVASAGGEYFESPVLGSIPQVEAGELLVLVGAREDQFASWLGLLGVFGPRPILVGRVGQAAAMKLALNQLIAALTAAFSLSLGIVLREGVPVDIFMKVLTQSALYAPTFDKKLRRMLERDFARPHFPVRSLLKDVDLVVAECERLGLETAGVEGVREVVAKALAAGWAEADYSALYNVVNPPDGERERPPGAPGTRAGADDA